MKKIITSEPFSTKAHTRLTDAGFQITNIQIAPSQLASYLNNEKADVLVTNPKTILTSTIIKQFSSIKLIVNEGVDNENINTETLKEQGITLLNTPNAGANAIAELVFAHLLNGVRFLHQSNREMPLEGDTNFHLLHDLYKEGQELAGKTLGIIGFGRTGKAVASLALRWGMNILVTDTAISSEKLVLKFPQDKEISYEITTTTPENVLKNSDFITLHIPKQENFYLSTTEMQQMKQGVGVINISDSSLIDEIALFEHLNKHHIAFAGLDTYLNEPSPSVQMLMNPSNSLSPRIARHTKESKERISEEIASAIIQHFS